MLTKLKDKITSPFKSFKNRARVRVTGYKDKHIAISTPESVYRFRLNDIRSINMPEASGDKPGYHVVVNLNNQEPVLVKTNSNCQSLQVVKSFRRAVDPIWLKLTKLGLFVSVALILLSGFDSAPALQQTEASAQQQAFDPAMAAIAEAAAKPQLNTDYGLPEQPFAD